MPEKERERIGQFVITRQNNVSSDGITCAQCQKVLSHLDTAKDLHTPSPEELFREGAVPIPNFGWLCSQACAVAYEAEFGVRFQRDASGKIDYGY
jgi:hypothetical protein